jgi:hypothetical protein
MPLGPGAKLGPYEVLAPLGAGGWLRSTGRGTRASIGPWRSRCCPREWPRTPNILAIHDFGSSNGTAYAVMELLEGET